MYPSEQQIANLFERQQRYVIPLYQRRYVWSKDKQWEPLWQDIQQRAEEELEDSRNVRPHFLGAIVMATIPTYGGDLPAYEIIDGQQRLTTFQIFLAAFRDVAKELNIHSLQRDLQRVTVNDGRLNREDERFKVWPTRFDQTAFKEILSDDVQDSIIDDVLKAKRGFKATPNISAAYVYFRGIIRDWLTEAADSDEEARANALLTALQRHLKVVTIELDRDDDPQVIFETLNARGEPLQAADLVRNYIFSDASQRQENVEYLFDNYWADFDKDGSFWRKSESRGRASRSQLTWFLTDFLTVKLEDYVTPAHIFEMFKRWWSSRPQNESAEAGLLELIKYADAYRTLIESEQEADSRLGVFYRRLKLMETSTLTPLLLYLTTDARLDTSEMDKTLHILESYVVRRFALGLSSKNYNQFFMRLLKDLRALSDDESTVEHLRAALSSSQGDSVRWPTDEEILANLPTLQIYRKLRAKGVSMILEAIDLHHTTGKQERLLIEDQLTVEHVMPQRWMKHWPEPAAPSDVLDAENWRNTYIHTLGNLTLTTQKLNSALSNGPYEAKRAELARQSRLRLNVLFQTQQTWDEDIIQRRGKELSKDITRIWEGPTPIAVTANETNQQGGVKSETALPESHTDQAQAVNPYQTIQSLLRDLMERPIERLSPRESDDGGILLVNHSWGTQSLRYFVKVATHEHGETQIAVLLANTFGQNSQEKPLTDDALLSLAEVFSDSFSPYPTKVSGENLTVYLPDDTPATVLRTALERTVEISLSQLERTIIGLRQPSISHDSLDKFVKLLSKKLPQRFYPMANDYGTERPLRRVIRMGWPVNLYYVVEVTDGEWQFYIRDYLSEGPLKDVTARQWPTLAQAVQEKLLSCNVLSETTPSGHRLLKVTTPYETEQSQLIDWFVDFVKATEPVLLEAMATQEQAEAISL